MEGIVRLVIDIIGYLWPFRAVEQWERGVYYVLGFYWKTVGPGRWPVIPFFMNVIAVSVVPVPVSGPLQNITLKDNSSLTFSATAVVCVRDAARALNAVDNYRDSIVELVSAELAERMARVKPDRVTDPDNRAGLVRDLVRWLNEQTEPYGMEVVALRFPNFVLNTKTYRLLIDQAVVEQAGW